MTSRPMIVLTAALTAGLVVSGAAMAQTAPEAAAPEAAAEAPPAAAAPAGVDATRDRALIDDLYAKLTTEVVMLTLASRNAEAGDTTQDEIDALDTQWRAERESDDQPLITGVLASPLSGYLLHIQAGSLGLYSEIFVMDANGLNAGQSAITSDYWQGIENHLHLMNSVKS